MEALARKLEDEAGLKPFLDKWHLVPGEPWQEALEKALDEAKTCAVFIGSGGISPWENEEMRSALDIRNRALGPRHSYTAQSLNNLASLLKEKGRYDEAELLYRRAFETIENALGSNHPSTITVRKNLQRFLRKRGREDEAASFEENS